jgi:arabinogalactan endo-1,4-beta-galactosidase
VGVKTQANETAAAQVLAAFMSEAKKLEACAGVFYWEPQVYGSWKPAYYTTLNWNAYDMGAFTSAGKPSKVMDAFKD